MANNTILSNVTNLTIKVDTAAHKLADVVDAISVDIDRTKDLSQLTTQELDDYHTLVSTYYAKLLHLVKQINSPFNAICLEQERIAAARQTSLFDLDSITIKDTDGSSSVIKFQTTTHEFLNRALIDKETGLQVVKNVVGVDVYSKPCVRAKKRAVKDAILNGSLSAECINTTKVSQVVLDFDGPIKDDDTQSLLSINSSSDTVSAIINKYFPGKEVK